MAFVTARFPRSYIDANRSLLEVDPLLLDEPWPGPMSGGPKVRLGKGLVVLQVGMSLTLVAGATLFVRTLRNLQTFDAGFARDRILLFSLSPPGASYKEVRLANLYGEVLARLRTTPGVLSASFSTLVSASTSAKANIR